MRTNTSQVFVKLSASHSENISGNLSSRERVFTSSSSELSSVMGEIPFSPSCLWLRR